MKLSLILALVLSLALFAAGSIHAGPVSVGAKVGMIASNITHTPSNWEPDKSFGFGMTGGLFAVTDISERLSIQPELLYAQRGVKANLIDGFIPIDLTARFDYVELPVLLKYTFPVEGAFKPAIFAGPVVAFTLSSELEVSASIFSTSVDISGLTHVTEFAFLAGFGFDVEAGERTLTFDARFQRGFTNVLLTGDFEINGSRQTIDEDDFKNYGFAFLVGYVL